MHHAGAPREVVTAFEIKIEEKDPDPPQKDREN
jgi:hypothetical protein